MLDYDNTCAESIVEYAKKLKGKSLLEACGETIKDHGYRGKGNFGQLLEKYYFRFEPNSDAEADFYEAGIELKSSPLKQLKNKEYRAKERLVLNIINYLDIHEEEFEDSTFYQKNKHLLLVLYLHEKGVDVIDLIIHLVDEWKFPETDLQIIRHDWETIVNKIRQGKAHELSEGDTFYLGAATKGSTAESSMRKQPFSKKKARQRAFSFKQSYLNHIISTIAKDEKKVYGKIIKHPEILEKTSIEEYIVSLFEPYYNLSPQEIEDRIGVELSKRPKNYLANLTNLIFGLDVKEKLGNYEEFQKADIEIKTVKLLEDNMPSQHVSFRNFKFKEIVNTSWENSEWYSTVNKKMFFVFYKVIDGATTLTKVKFWNMPNEDIKEAEKVWRATKRLVKQGKIIKGYSKDGEITYNHLPKSTENRVSHVRPKGGSKNTTYKLPVTDLFSGDKEFTRQCFWFNKKYVRDEIYNK